MRSLGASGGAPILTVASASTTDIGAARADSLSISGTTSISSLGTAPTGTKRELTFQGALTLTHNATSLVLPGGANIVTAAGDVAGFVSLGSGNWRCTSYMRADGTAVAASGLGYAQTWQSLAGSRALGVTYTNSTGRPIFVSIYLVTGSGGVCYASVGGVVVGGVNESAVGEKGVLGFVVPNGATYVASVTSGSMTIDTWAELR